MAIDITNATLQPKEAAAAQRAYSADVDNFLDPDKPRENIVGMGYGIKWSDGQPTGKPALLALVRQKLARDEVAKADMVPRKIKDMQTDVLEVGELFADQAEPQEAAALALAKRVRPASGGYSVGHKDITAGTLATCVYDQLGTPGDPIGIPRRYYILSNNHVLAKSNDGNPGDSILQPGPFDGGLDPQDRIARLSRFIPIAFDPPTNRRLHRNLVDAALAEGDFDDLKREIHWVGHVRGWLRRDQINVGMQVHKCGRTTNFSVGRITAVGAVIDVNYGGGRVARFRDQIITTNMSAGGDSGSLVVSAENEAVGLLFAGSPVATIINQIQHVRSLLRVEIA